MGICYSCCRLRGGYEQLDGDDNPGDPTPPPAGTPSEGAGLHDLGVHHGHLKVPLVDLESPGWEGRPSTNSNDPADPSRAGPCPPPCPSVDIPSAGVPGQTPQGPAKPAPQPQPPPPPPPPPPPQPPPMPGMPDTARIPPWLKAKKKYDKRRATRPVRWQMIAPSAMERRSVWSRADEARFDSPQFQAQLLRAFAAKQPRAGGSTGATCLPTPASPAEASSVFSKDALQNFDILTKSAKVSYDEIARATLTGDMASLSHIKSIKGLLASLQKINEEEELALRERQGEGAPLQPPELFYLQLVDEGHLSERLRCLLFHFTRAEVLDQARKEQEVVLAALSAVVSSQGLTQLTQLLLFILNFLNEGPTSSPAYGFNLCDIDKINSVRMTDPAEGGTLLDLVVRECQKSHPDILNVITELEPVDKATGADEKNRKSAIRSFRVEITKLECDLDSLPDAEPHGAFSKTMLEWTRKVELLERGEGEIGAEWERLRVKFSLKGETSKPLLSSLATFRGDFKKVMDKNKRPSSRKKKHESAC